MMCQFAVERAKDDEKAKLFGAGRGSLDRRHCQFIDTLIPALLGLAWLGLPFLSSAENPSDNLHTYTHPYQ